MKSSLSFCNRTVLSKNVRRFAPLWALYLALILFIGPVLLTRQYFEAAAHLRVDRITSFMADLVTAGWFLSFVYALLCAVMCFKYLHTTRSAYMLHALPVDRSTYYCTNVLTGLLFALVPMLLSAFLCFVLLLSFGIPNAAGLAFGTLLYWTLQYLCFFGIAVFCMMLTGRTVIGVLTYLAVNGIGFLLPLLICATVEPLFYGFDYQAESFLIFSPILQGFNDKPISDAGLLPALWVWIYAAVGVGLLALGWLHYRKRQIERVGDAMIYGWAKVVFQVLFTVLCAFALGWLLWLILSGFDDQGINRLYLPFLLCLSVGCFVGWFAARMMLKRTVRVFQKRGWLGCGIAVAVLCVFVLALRFDVLGVQRWVPSESSVQSVEIQERWSSNRLTLTEQAQIARVTTIHRAMLEERQLWETDGNTGNAVTIRYRLRGGLTVSRTYYRVNAVTDARRLLTELFSDTAIVKSYYRRLLDQLGEKTKYIRLSYWDRDGLRQVPLKVSVDELFAAILSDAEAGRLPIECHFTEDAFYFDSDEDYNIVFSENDPNESNIYFDRTAEYIRLPHAAAETLRCFGIMG